MKKIILLIIASLIFTIGCKKEDDKFKVSTIIAYTGTAAATGVELGYALDLCAEDWNEKGGILGKQIVIDHNDSRSESKQGRIIANKLLIGNKPNIVISAISGIALSAQPTLEKNNIINLAIVATDKIYEISPKYTIRSYVPAVNICDFFIDSLSKSFNSKDFVLFYENNEFGHSFYQGFNKQVINNEIRLSRSIQFNSNETDYRNFILKQNLDNKEIIYIAGQFQSLGRFIKQLRESGFLGIIVCDSSLNSAAALDLIGNNRQNLYYIDVAQNPKAELIRDRLEKKHSKKINDVSLIGYNVLDALLQYINKEGTVDSDILMKGINGFTCEGILGSTSFNNYDVSFNLSLKKIEDNE